MLLYNILITFPYLILLLVIYITPSLGQVLSIWQFHVKFLQQNAILLFIGIKFLLIKMLSELDRLSKDLLMFIRHFHLIIPFSFNHSLITRTIVVFLTNFSFYQCDGMLQQEPTINDVPIKIFKFYPSPPLPSHPLSRYVLNVSPLCNKKLQIATTPFSSS